jgi:hypothetical protein
MAPVFRTILSLLAVSASAAVAAPSFDQVRIRSDYRDGEFEKVIRELRGFLKTGRACSRSDSIFLAKHLGVVYAAHPGTRELGRHHMFRLLRMAPESDLLDMFVGEEVGGVFEKVRKEHALSLAESGPQTPRASAAETAGEPVDSGEAERNSPDRENAPASGNAAHKAAWRDPGIWIGGSAALAVVAFTFIYAGGKQAP